MAECVDLYHSGWALEEIVELYAPDGPSANQVRGWWWRARGIAKHRAKESWRPGGRWAESRGQKDATNRDFRTFAELNTEKPYGLGYSKWESMAVLAARYRWEIGPKAISERARAWGKDRRVRYYKRKLRLEKMFVRRETREDEIVEALQAYDEKAAEWLKSRNLNRASPAEHFIAERRADRLDKKYNQTPEAKEQSAVALLMNRLNSRLDSDDEGERPALPERTTDDDPVDAEIVDDE